ncbi:TIGR02530 family flagellar biosynthesis protein [Bdellovibrionota bacterium FG-2]
MSNGSFLYPNVTSLPGQSGIKGPDSQEPKKKPGEKGEFDHVFEKTLGKIEGASKPDLGQVRDPLKFSAHATQRLRDRKITLDAALMEKVNEAIDKAEAKGVEDTLILTKDAALIVSVKNRTVVTAMDRNALSGNVFTNIDGAVII